jgi:hypothetical protein
MAQIASPPMRSSLVKGQRALIKSIDLGNLHRMRGRWRKREVGVTSGIPENLHLVIHSTKAVSS